MQYLRVSFFAAAMAASVISAQLEQRDLDECTSAASALVDGLSAMPTPDKSLDNYFAKETQWEAVVSECVIPAVTGSMAAAYTSYAKSFESWVSEFEDDLSSVYDACKDVPEVMDELSSAAIPASGFCSSYSWADATATGTATAKATDSTTGSATGSVTETASSTSTPTNVAENAGARSSGMGVAAVAIVGLAIARAY
ncbi:Ff.00g107650.m01.CDS01 [Fusarium sp. VM40]|nr:Ff.00g107650.m01.CDS01 [Fusarium sp. VM40]